MFTLQAYVMYLHVLGHIGNSPTDKFCKWRAWEAHLYSLLRLCCALSAGSTVEVMRLREGTKTSGPTLGTG